ncbi:MULTISPECIES: ABC transporter permease [unclassified Pseudactinotalea]|uniref:ABC transporter permease n=1 Tax=unclassified Pseudactinotalea TaxID=2649176 RepID=UPI00128E6657|nr:MULTISPECIES: ABC transporter permease [unclassified Pseudactinotalea]MPV50583.1 ABC transporter permease [Pseudactinotalea sp. HY160]QGH70741.1 ABC transporter permease [Pseudactinotalea sp. HY158]
MTTPTTTEVRSSTAGTGAGLMGHLRTGLQQMLAFAGLIVIMIVFSLASPVFFTFDNIVGNMLFSAVVIGTLALGTTFVIITAGIDLSIGTGMALCAVMAGNFITNIGLSWQLGVVLAIAFGGLVGLVNGVFIAVAKLPPFIATLAMMMVAEGLALVFSDSAPIYVDRDTDGGFMDLSTGTLIPQVPNAVLVLIGAAIIAGIVLNRTVLGRYTYAIGSNEEATAISGVNVTKWKILIYTFAGLFTGLAGVMIAARLGSAQPAIGMGYELQAIAAVVIGGTSLMGGKGSIVGTVIGALIISVINNGLQLMSVPQEWQNVILGAVILAAVFADTVRQRTTT